MTVFDVHILHYNWKFRKARPEGYFHLSNFHRCVQLFVSFTYKLVNDLVLKEKDRDGQRQHKDANTQGYVKKYFLEKCQSSKNGCAKIQDKYQTNWKRGGSFGKVPLKILRYSWRMRLKIKPCILIWRHISW